MSQIIYKYSKRHGKKVHILNPLEGKTWCKLEHSTAGKKLTLSGSILPQGRTVCSICTGMRDSHFNGSAKAPSGKARSSGFRNDQDFYGSWEWASLRYEVLKKHGPRCMLCGANSRTHKIVVDHIKSRNLHPELELDFNNCQVLCDQCNRGKGRTDETDWRDLNEELNDQAASHMKNL